MKKLLLAGAIALSAGVCRAEQADTLTVHSLDKVVVTSLRSDILKENVPNRVEVVTQGDLARATATSLSEMIFSFTPAEAANMQGLTGGIELRGFAPDGSGKNRYTLLLIDGVRMGTYNAAATTLGGIRAIEVVKGPFASLYGSGAMGGVINVVTRQSQGDIHGGASRSWGSFNTSLFNAHVGGSITSDLDFDVNVDYLNQAGDYKTGGHNILKMGQTGRDGLVVPYSRDTTYKNTAYDQTHLMLRLGWDISEAWRLNLFNDTYYTGRALANGTLWGYYGQTSKNDLRQLYRADLTGRAGIHSIRVTPYMSFEDSHIDDQGMSARSDMDLATFGVSAQDAMDFGFGTLLVGLDNLTERHSTVQKDYFDLSPKAPFLPDYNNMQTGVFTQFNFSLFDGRFSGIAGLRYDNIRVKTLDTPMLASQSAADRSYNTVTPNLSLQYRFLKAFRIHAGIGRAFLTPEAYKMAGNYSITGEYMGFPYRTDYFSNSSLKPETAVTWEAGLGYAAPSGALEADASLFFTDHKNLIVDESAYNAATDATEVRYVNANRASIYGLELSATFDLGRMLEKSWSWKFHGSYTRIFRSEVETPTETREREYLSRTKATFNTVFVTGRVTAGLSARYTGGKVEQNLLAYYLPATMRPAPTVATHPLMTNPASLVFDLTASCRIYKGFSVGVKAANLLDELYMERDGFYMPGRNFMGTLSFTF